MANEQLSVDELLTKQASAAFLATLESVEGEPTMVKITPWVPQSGCLCHLAFNLKKAAIRHVELTDEKHVCCSKILNIVQVQFQEKATMSVTELFSQLLQSARASGHHSHFSQGTPAAAVGVSDDHSRNLAGIMARGVGTCGPGQISLLCPGFGGPRCEPSGSFCCGNEICHQGQMCLLCPGLGLRCAPSGSRCCGNEICFPGQTCLLCPGFGGPRCAPSGSFCCGNDICHPGQTCSFGRCM